MLGWTIVLSALATSLLIAPVARFLQTGWLNKFNDIRNNFDARTIQIYFTKYKSSFLTQDKSTKLHKLTAEKDHALLVSEFENLYKSDLRKLNYFWPFSVLLLISFIESVAVIQSALIYIDLGIYAASFQPPANFLDTYADQLIARRAHALFPALVVDATTSAALLGAYLWVVQDMIRRMRSGDMLPSDLYWAALRLAVSAPLGLSVGSLVNVSVSPGVAFAMGAFPIESIQRILRVVAARTLSVSNDPDTDGDEVKKLIGVNNDVAHRLIIEDASSVLALVKADPVRLAMRTNLRFEVVTELMGQAVVWLNVACAKPEDTAVRMENLRGSGLDTATGVADFMARYEASAGKPEERAEHDRLIEGTAASFGSTDGAKDYGKDRLKEVLGKIAKDDVTLFLMNLKSAAR